MLKLTYTETSFDLERLAQSVEEWVALRVALALRLSQGVHLEPSTAAFLLPTELPELHLLEREIRRLQLEDQLQICPCDPDYVEIVLHGVWFKTDYNGAEGVFLAALDDRLEVRLCRLWQAAQICLSVM